MPTDHFGFSDVDTTAPLAYNPLYQLQTFKVEVDDALYGVAPTGVSLADPGADGILVRTAIGVTDAVQLVAPAAGFTIADPSGVSGGVAANPTFALANDLAALEALTGTGFPKRTGVDAWSLGSLGAADIPDLSGTYQPLDADLTTIAGLTATTDNFIVSVSSAWASRTPAQVRTTLGLVIGTDVQAYDADLATWAGITPGTGVGTALAINVGTAGAFLPNNGAGTSLTGIPYTITGTASQVIASAGTGNITLSLPQSIATTSTPQFARLGLGQAAHATAVFASTGSGDTTRFTLSDTASYLQFSFLEGTTKLGFMGYQGSTSSGFLGGAGAVVLGTLAAKPVALITNTAVRMTVTDVGNVKIGGTAVRGTTEGTSHLDIFNGTAPVGTLASGSSFYSAAGIPTVMDSSGLANGLGQTSSPIFAGLTVNGTIGASANLTIAPTGDVIFNPAGNDILPTTNYDLNLGSLSLKYLTVHAAELWVETLVAQDTIATIGGRILVGPTTVLTSDISAVATTILVKHNEMAVGDRIYMEAAGAVEFMAVTAGPTGTGPYSYTVTRNLDASGANAWSAGDAVFNTGTTGDGFIDLYSVRGVKASSQVGPAIVGNVRNSATYNDWSEHWAIGQLNGVYGYGVSTYGVGLGEYAASKFHTTLDSTNGLRFFTGLSTVIGQWSALGVITVGEVAASKSNVLISAGALSVRLNTTALFNVDTSGNVLVGQTGASQSNVYLTAGTVSVRNNTTSVFNVDTAGTVVVGQTAASQSNIQITSGALNLRTNTTVYGSLSTAGVLTLGEVGASKVNTLISGGALSMRLNTTQYFGIDTSGNVTMGEVATDSPNLHWDDTLNRLLFRGGTGGTETVGMFHPTQGLYIGATDLGGSGSTREMAFTLGAPGSSSTICASRASYNATQVTGEFAAQTNTARQLSLKINSTNSAANQQATVELQSNATTYGITAFTLYSRSSGLHATLNRSLTVGDSTVPGATLDVQGTGVFTGGVTFGSPTGGNKGAGTINAVGVYDDNVLLTDWVFDLHYDGSPKADDKFYRNGVLYSLEQTKAITQDERRLPWMPLRAEFESERNLGGMVSRLWQGQEQQQIYIMQLEDEIKTLRQQIRT